MKFPIMVVCVLTTITCRPRPVLSQRYLYQLIDAIGYCHGKQMLHRDLKPSVSFASTTAAYSHPLPRRVNVAEPNPYARLLSAQNLLIDRKGQLKLADFGMARTICIRARPYTNSVGHPWPVLPEFLLFAIWTKFNRI